MSEQPRRGVRWRGGPGKDCEKSEYCGVMEEIHEMTDVCEIITTITIITIITINKQINKWTKLLAGAAAGGSRQ